MGAVSGRHVGHFSPWPLQCFHVATASCTPTLPPRSQGALHMCGLCTHSIAGWRETCGPRAPWRPWAALRDLPIGWAEGCHANPRRLAVWTRCGDTGVNRKDKMPNPIGA